MAWRELIADNGNERLGATKRVDKALISIFRDEHLYFKITCRYHEDVFKYYVDCPQCDTHECLLGPTSELSRVESKNMAIRIIQERLNRRNTRAFSSLTGARIALDKFQIKYEYDTEKRA